jgi:hypothetical protein
MKTRKLIPMCLIAAVAAYVGARTHQRVMAAEQRRPFLARLTETVTNGHGVAERTAEFVFAVRRDGSFADATVSERFADGRPGRKPGRKLTLVPERAHKVVVDEAKVVTSFPYSEKGIAALAAPPSDPSCRTQPELTGAYQVLGDDSYLGFRVVRIVKDDPSVRTEKWEAPDLSCFPLKLIYNWKRKDGSLDGRTEKVAVSVEIGEPPSSLFIVPTDYREMPPSQAFRETEKLSGPLPQAFAERVQELDRRYQEAQKRANGTTQPDR